MKQQLGAKTGQTKMLGIKWDKKKEKLIIEIPSPIHKITKQNILQKLASVYDVIGFISPCTLVGKDVFRKICDEKMPWEKELPPEIKKIWLKGKNIYHHMVRYQDLSSVFKRKSEKQGFTYLGMQAQSEQVLLHMLLFNKPQQQHKGLSHASC